MCTSPQPVSRIGELFSLSAAGECYPIFFKPVVLPHCLGNRYFLSRIKEQARLHLLGIGRASTVSVGGHPKVILGDSKQT